MKQLKVIALIVIASLLLGGCASQNQPTAHEKLTQDWKDARAGVLFGLAKQQYESANLTDARKSADDAIALQPDSVPLRLLSARVSIEQGQLEAAVQELQKVHAIDPANAEADYLLGVVYQRWSKPESALKWYIEAYKSAPAEPAYLLAQAETLVVTGRPEEALAMLLERLSFFENSAPVRDAAGQVLISLKRYQQAVPLLREATMLSQGDLQIREHYSLALYYAGNYREALALLEKLRVGDQANRVDLLLAQGECYVQLGRPREGRELLAVAARTYSAQPNVWLALAKADLACDDTVRAEMDLKKALDIDLKSADAQVLLGYLRLKQNRLAEASAAFREASTLQPTDPLALCMVGYVLEKQGRPAEALQMYGRALQLKPGDELASMLLSAVDGH